MTECITIHYITGNCHYTCILRQNYVQKYELRHVTSSVTHQYQYQDILYSSLQVCPFQIREDYVDVSKDEDRAMIEWY